MFSFTPSSFSTNALSTPATAQPLPAGQNTGSYAMQATTTSYSVPQSAATNVPIAPDTPYTKLPAQAREEIDAVFDKFKRPSRECIASIADQEDGFMNDISDRLKAANLLLLRTENKQIIVRHDLTGLRDDAMQVCSEARKSGHSCLEEVRQYGSGRLSKSDQAAKFHANEFFLAAFGRLAQRLEVFAEEAARIERQLVSMQALASRKRESFQDVGMYGESPKIGLNELVHLIKNQHTAFLAVSARIAECHRDADHLRAAFKRCFPTYATVFDDEDRREAADGRMSALRVKEQFREHLLMEARDSKSAAAGDNNAAKSTAIPAPSNAFYAPIGSATMAAANPSNIPTAIGFGMNSAFGGASTATPATNAFGSAAAPSAWGTSATGAAPSNAFGSFGSAQPAATATNLLGSFGNTQPATSAGDLAGVGMNRSFSTSFGTTANSDSKSKTRNRRK